MPVGTGKTVGIRFGELSDQLVTGTVRPHDVHRKPAGLAEQVCTVMAKI